MKKALLFLVTICLMAAICAVASADNAENWTDLTALISGPGNMVSITLSADISADRNDEVLTIPAGKTVTIDLNGHTLSRGTVGISSGQYLMIVSEGAVCRIQGSGTMTDQEAEVTRYALILNNGTLTLDGAALRGNSLCIKNTGTVTMNSGSMTSASNSAIESAGADSSFTMNGGSISGIQFNFIDCGAVKLIGGSFTMTGGEITENIGRPAIWCQEGTMVMTGGTISDNDCVSSYGYGCVFCRDSDFTMTGGQITGNTGRIAGGVFAGSSSKTFSMTGGSITGNTGVKEDTSRGGGVYSPGTTKLSGNVQIAGNYVRDGETITAADLGISSSSRVIIEGPLTSTARVGIRPWMNILYDAKQITSGMSTKDSNGVPYATEENVFLNVQPGSGIVLFSEGEYYATGYADVSVDANGGSGTTTSVQIPRGVPWPLPACDLAAPTTPAGTVFEGWWFNNELKQPGETVTITGAGSLKAMWMSPWGALKKQIESSDTLTNTFTTIELEQDIVAGYWDQYITVKSGQKILLDLAGHTMDCSAIPSAYGYFFKVESGSTMNLRDDVGGGKLTGAVSTEYYPIENEGGLFLIGGSITGNYKGGVRTKGNKAQLWLQGSTISGNGLENNSYNEGIGICYEGGALNMSAGEISENKGSGVQNTSGGAFYMTGGTISENGSYGIYSGDAGYLEMSGGTITANATGVRVSQVYLSGMVTVTGNINKDVDLSSNYKIRFRDSLHDDARIGICVPEYPYTFTYGLKTNGKECAKPQNFIDNRGFCVTKKNYELVCIVGVRVTYTANGGTGDDITEQRAPGDYWKLPACSFTPPAGKEFEAWELNGTRYAERDSVTVSVATTVKAIWKRLETPDGTWADLQTQIDEGSSPVICVLTANMLGDAADNGDQLIIPSGKTVIIDLNGYCLDRNRTLEEGLTYLYAHGITVRQNAELVIRDSYEEKTGSITLGRSEYPCITVMEGGTLTLEGGSIEGNYKAAIDNSGTFIMNGGTIRENGHTQPGAVISAVEIAVQNSGNAQMTMNGGSISDNNGWAIWNNGTSTLTLNGGIISGNSFGGIRTDTNAFMTMTGGTISSNGYKNSSHSALAIYGSVTMTGGTIRENNGYFAVSINTASGQAGSFTMTGGSIEDNHSGGVSYSAGNFSIGGNIAICNNINEDDYYSYDITLRGLPIHIIDTIPQDVSIIVELRDRPGREGVPPIQKITDGFLDEQGVPRAYSSSFNLKYRYAHRIMQDGEIAFAEWNEFYMDEADFVFPEGITTIEAEAFVGIDAEVIVIPNTDNQITIGSKAFVNCYNLRQIYVPSNVTSIAEDAFDDRTAIIIFGDRFSTPAEQYAKAHDNCEYWTKVKPENE